MLKKLIYIARYVKKLIIRLSGVGWGQLLQSNPPQTLCLWCGAGNVNITIAVDKDVAIMTKPDDYCSYGERRAKYDAVRAIAENEV